MTYRREIDGLRALAVLSVILFHAGFETFSGGFVGVDVFFVISGYLITTIILSELEQGKFSIVDFYERRARRILPALFLVMLVCIPFAWLWLLSSDMKDFSQSLVAVSVFASNILFWRESGYFEAAAEFKPLLHTWSLAVEEQYYVLFPVFMMLFWRLGKRWTLVTLGLVFVASLAVAQWAAYAMPVAAFYLLPTRGWELLIGAFAAFYLSKANRQEVSKAAGEAGGWLGVTLIFYAVFAYSKATPFPGLYALVPTLGTILIILFATQQTTAGKFVGNKAFVGVGLISYSAYLWYQPLFAFARHTSLTEPSPSMFIALSVLTLVLAYLSWKFVEVPFRNKEFLSRKAIFYFFCIGTSFFTCIGLSGHFQIIKSRFVLPDSFASQFSNNKLRSSCDDGDQKFGKIKFCRLGSENYKAPSFAVFGDSHANALNPVFDKIGKELGISYVHHGLGACLPLLGIDVSKGNWDKGICQSIAEEQFQFVKENKIKKVFLVGRWSLYTQGEYDKNMTRYFLTSHDSQALTRQSSRDVFTEAVSNTISSYNSIGVRVIVILQVPQQKSDPKRVYSKLIATNKIGSDDALELVKSFSVEYSEHLILQAYNRSIFRTLEENGSILVLNPDPYFCEGSRCLSGTASESFFRDDDHLNSIGAMRLESEFLKFLKQ